MNHILELRLPTILTSYITRVKKTTENKNKVVIQVVIISCTKKKGLPEYSQVYVCHTMMILYIIVTPNIW